MTTKLKNVESILASAEENGVTVIKGHETELGQISDTFKQQKSAYSLNHFPEYETRIATLQNLYEMIDSHSLEICEALNADFGCRSESESMLTDVVGSLSSIRYLIRNLRRFMRPQSKRTSIWYLPGKNKVEAVPLGVVGVMSPWNYPVHLMIAPVAAAIAAGNRVMAKMSELTPNTTALIQRLVAERFEDKLFSIVTGGIEVSAEFSSLPFDHLMFTGSTKVGKKIALAAARNLTPVTLELSGKSPVVICNSYDIEEASQRIIWGKAFNAGQTCVAPDYVFVPEDKLIEFVRYSRKYLTQFYPDSIDTENYTSVINNDHFQRITDLIKDAEKNGVEVIALGEKKECGHKLPVSLVINPTKDCKIYKEEVFGPLLSVFTYKSIDEVIEQISHSEDPLAMYIFSHYDAEVKYIYRSVRAAGISVNDTLLHYLQNDLPFGGRGNSGNGKCHGREGFETFSHLLPIFKQRGVGNFTGLKLLYPPYGKLSKVMGSLIHRMP